LVAGTTHSDELRRKAQTVVVDATLSGTQKLKKAQTAAKDATLYVTTEALSSSSLLSQQMYSVLFGLASHQSRHVFDMSFSSAQTGSIQSG